MFHLVTYPNFSGLLEFVFSKCSIAGRHMTTNGDTVAGLVSERFGSTRAAWLSACLSPSAAAPSASPISPTAIRCWVAKSRRWTRYGRRRVHRPETVHMPETVHQKKKKKMFTWPELLAYNIIIIILITPYYLFYMDLLKPANLSRVSRGWHCQFFINAFLPGWKLPIPRAGGSRGHVVVGARADPGAVRHGASKHGRTSGPVYRLRVQRRAQVK